MISASEALKVSIDNYPSYAKSCMISVGCRIKDATNRGEFGIKWVGYLPRIVKEDVEQLGYKLESFERDNQVVYKISWGSES